MVIENSFIRIIITICTGLALIALLIRNWLYIYWIDYKNPKLLAIRLMEIENKNWNEEEVSKVES